MKRDAAVDVVAQRCGNRTDLANRIINEMFLIQKALEARTPHPWFLEKLAKVTAEPDDDMVKVPRDFIVEAEEGGIVPIVDGERKQPLVKRDYDELAARFPGSAERPEAYALVSEWVVFFPKFTKTFEYMFLYIGKDQELTSDVENAWLREAPELVIAETGKKIAGSHLQSQRLREEFSESARIEWDTLIRRHEERKIANVEAFMGGE